MWVSRNAVVATATGLIVDVAPMPVYLAMQRRDVLPLWHYILLMTVAEVGTLIGIKLVRPISWPT